MSSKQLAFRVRDLVGVATARILGRSTSGSGRAEELTTSQVRTLLEVSTTSEIAAAYQPIGSYAASSHTHAISDVTGLQTAIDGKQSTLVSGTNIKTINSTSLLGSGDIVVSASPAGSSGQVQFNNAGSFGGAAALAYASTGTHLVVTAQSSTAIPLCARGAASQTANIFECKNSSSTNLFYVTAGGGIAAAGVAWTGKTYYQDGFSAVGWGLSAGNWYFGNGSVDWKFGLHTSHGPQVFSGTLGFNANSPGSPSDTGLSRNNAGVVEVNNGTAGTFRDFIVRNLRMSAPTLVPASASATGSEGQIAWDANYIYVCTAANTWKRVAIATW